MIVVDTNLIAYLWLSSERSEQAEALLRLMVAKLGLRTRLVHLSPRLGIFFGRLIGLLTRDVVLTTGELEGLMQSLLTSTQPPNGKTRFSDWLEASKETVGSKYSSEIQRHFKWPGS